MKNRPAISGYGYDNGGRLVSTTYSDSTPAVSITYDALSRQLTQSNGLATSAFTYNPSNLQIDTETITYTLPGADSFTRILDRSQDTLGRDTGWELKDNTTIENSVAYTYGAADGRLSSVAGVSNSGFQYGYEANSNLIASVTGPAHTVTNTWDPTRNVLDKKENKVGTIEISSYDYSVNGIGQRTSVATSGTAFSGASSWNWSYDSLGQVTLAEHGTNSNFHRSYAYDAIGNRQRAAAGTLDVNDTSAAVYTANALNQYSSINDPSSTILNPTHDADGNMTSGPLPVDPASASTLTWDAENRLISATVNSTTVTYTYDAQSRRIATKVGSNTTLVVYDAWNPIAEYEGSAGVPPALAKGYTWGIDLSGSSQGAGGVGGLLAVAIHDQQSAIYYPTFDGNGNVSEYLDSTGAIVAHYEYDPFGRIVVESGTQSADFAHRFSTKPVDSVTGLLYYGYRWYDPVTGRWPSRDPIEEEGGINLYAFVGNNGIEWVDVLGKAVHKIPITSKSFIEGYDNNGFGPDGVLDGSNHRMRNFIALNDLAGTTIIDGVPMDDEKNGSYRLFGTVTLNLCCTNSQLLFPVLSNFDKDGGAEAFGLRGTSNAITKVERLSGSDIGITLRVWGRPDTRLEFGLQTIRKRSSVNIWSHTQILFRCTGEELSFNIRAFSGSKFPSRKLWINGKEKKYVKQGNFADLWKEHPAAPGFVAE